MKSRLMRRSIQRAWVANVHGHCTRVSMRLAYRGQANITTGVVDDLQHALPERRILDGELGEQATVIEEVGSVGILRSTFILKTDLGIGQVGADDVGDLTQADRSAAGV